MKSSFQWLALVSLGVMCVLPGALAQQDWEQRVYMKVDGGAAWLPNADVKEVFGPVPSGTEAEFDVGPRFGFAIGYKATDWFAAEFETGFMANSINKITGAWDTDATFVNVPLFVNARFQLPNNTPLTPYVGAGVGGASSVLDIDELHYGNTHVWGSAADFTFAWQGFAGLRYAINDKMGLGLEYHYIWADGPSFESDEGWYWYPHSDRIAFGEMQTHTISLQFDLTF